MSDYKDAVSAIFDVDQLDWYIERFIMYELYKHDVDPRITLTGTSFKLDSIEEYNEGYKYSGYDKWHTQILQGGPYINIISRAISDLNLADHRHTETLEEYNQTNLEFALTLLYEGDEDASAFTEITKITGRRFDLLAFLFFLKDSSRYMPTRSVLFDDRFRKLGLDSQLENNCSWDKYVEYNKWLSIIQSYLCENLNPDITLIDAHSFVWMIQILNSFKENSAVLMRHKKYGIGICEDKEKDNLEVDFKGTKRTFLKESINTGLLTEVSVKPESVLLLNAESTLPEEIIETDAEPIYEGAKKQVIVNAYERDDKARRKCLQYYLRRDGRIVCQVCGFDFGKVYGAEYTNKIHVHHIRPLSEINNEYQVNPTEDLLPVCPNCHMVLHANGGISIDELKRRLQHNAN